MVLTINVGTSYAHHTLYEAIGAAQPVPRQPGFSEHLCNHPPEVSWKGNGQGISLMAQ